VLFLALAGMAVVHRLRGRNADAATAGTEALELYLAGGPRRFRNRIDPQRDMMTGASAACSVLGALAAEAADGDRAGRMLGFAERLREDGDVPVPSFQQDDVERARDAAVALLGGDGFAAAFDLGWRGDLGAAGRAKGTALT